MSLEMRYIRNSFLFHFILCISPPLLDAELPLDGSWSPWTSWTCTPAAPGRPCEFATFQRTRACTDPEPKFGQWIGERS